MNKIYKVLKRGVYDATGELPINAEIELSDDAAEKIKDRLLYVRKAALPTVGKATGSQSGNDPTKDK